MREKRLPEVLASLPSAYTAINGDGSHPIGVVSPIGKGGSGVVFRALYRDRLHRAVKIMLPAEYLEDSLGTQLFRDGFDNEVAALATLSHENIARVTDFGQLVVGERSFPFVVTEYVAGMPLDEYCADRTTSGKDIITVLKQILDALAYMHAHGVMHCDVKPANILVRPPNEALGLSASPVVVDLGVSHKVIEIESPEQDEFTYFFSSPRYVLSRLRTALGNESKNRVRRSELQKYFPWQDLHAFGVTLEDVLSAPGVTPKLTQYLGASVVEGLQHVRERLRNPRPGDNHYANAIAARTALERLPFGGISPLGIPELAAVPERGIVIPTNRTRVITTDRVLRLISHPLFQRLHNLPQLDLLHHVFPGATHTRFVHALHTYDLARIAIDHMLGSWQFRIDVDVSDINNTLFRSLLDSVGRYHFQHMFEDFFQDRKQQGLAKAGLLRGGELLDKMLDANAPDSRYKALRELRDSGGAALTDIVNECTGMDWHEVSQRGRHPKSPTQGFLAGLLSNPVDVDKLAYLMDDSAAAGLPFGNSAAPMPLFEALRVPALNDWNQLQSPKVAVAIREKAVSYIEQGILSRYWNIQAGYWYRTNRSLQAMVKFQLGSLLKAGRLDFAEFIDGTLHLSVDGALRWLDHEFRRAIQDGSLDERTVDPLDGLLQSRREIYKRLVTISPKSTLDERSKDRFIFEALARRSTLDDDQLCQDTARVLEELQPGLDIRPGEVLLDLPRVRREEMGGKMLVYSDNPGASLLGEIVAISPLLAGLQEQFDLYAKRLRIFVHPRIHDALDGKHRRAHEAVLSMLRSEFVEGA